MLEKKNIYGFKKKKKYWNDICCKCVAQFFSKYKSIMKIRKDIKKITKKHMI